MRNLRPKGKDGPFAASKYDHSGLRSQAHELEKSIPVEVNGAFGLGCDRLKCLLDV